MSNGPTLAQQKIIDYPSKNLLVSAAAGSGKTFTMTKRIISLLTDKNNKTSLSDLIVLTFTDAAAKNIKQKIIDELSKDESLKSELSHVDEADISTFDAFCNKFIQKYRVNSKINDDFTIADDALFEMKTKEFINDILGEYYIKPTVDFLQLVDIFTNGKDDNRFVECLYNYYRSIQNEIDLDDYLNTYKDKYFSDDFLDEICAKYYEIFKEIALDCLKLDIINGNILNCEDVKIYNYVNDIRNQLESLINTNNFDELFDIFIKLKKNYSKPNKSKLATYLSTTPEDIDNQHEKIDQLFNKTNTFRSKFIKIIEKLESRDIYFSELLRDDFEEYKPVFLSINEIMIKINDKLNDFKREYSLYSFLDIEKEAIRILKENEDIRDEYKKNIKEIIIDEYQDTNDIQSELISLISNDNVVVVGDIKQSIYRFRNSNPKIFEDLLSLYSNNNSNGKVLYLSENFRSRKEEVLDKVNEVFRDKALDKSLESPYFSDELRYGNKEYDKFNDPLNRFRIIKYKYTKEKDKDIFPREIDKEARIVAQDIRDRLDASQKVLTKVSLLNAEEKDFLILTRRNKPHKSVKKYLQKYGIASVMPTSDKFIYSEEIIFVKNSLRFINCLDNENASKEEFIMSACSILRSFIFKRSDNEITKFIFDIKKMPPKDAFESNFSDIYFLYEEIRNIYKEKGLFEALYTLFKNVDIYNLLPKLSKVESRENKLNYIVNNLMVFSSAGLSLDDIIYYFDYLNTMDQDKDVSLNSFEELSCAVGLTIHKSKGLEAPFVYLMDISKFRTNTPNYLTGYGYALPKFDDFLEIKTLLMQLIDIKENNKEALRLLYVALTRARESITIIVNNNIKPANNMYESLNLAQLLYLDYIPKQEYIVDFKDDDFYDYSSNNENKEIPLTELNYKSLSLPLMDVIVKERASHSLYEFNDEVKQALERGTQLHSYFEIVNFLNDIDEEIKEKMIPEDSIKYITNFKNQPIFNKKCIKEYHEHPYFKDNINGIIDYALETEDEFLIIDFKTKNIDDPGYVRQLNAYRKYIMTRTNKKISMYLYSIMDNILKEVDVVDE